MDQIDDGSIIHYPPRFGRGWIPAERDIGIPGEGDAVLAGTAGGTVAQSPSKGDGGGGFDPGAALEDSPLHQPAAGPPPRAGEELAGHPPHTGWTPERKVRFLDALAQHGNVRVACARVGISAEAAYRLRRRDFAFGEAWAAALVQARASVEQVLADRAIHGVEEHVWYRGELVGTRRRFDGRLLLAHLGRLDRMADEQVAPARLARFDELLAVVGGAAFSEDMADRDEGYRRAADPLLPMPRDRYVAEAGKQAGEAAREDALVALAIEMDGEDGPDPLGWESDFERRLDDEQFAALGEIQIAANQAARAAADADWTAWQERVAAVLDEAGLDAARIEEAVLDGAGPDGAGLEGAGAAETPPEPAAEPPLEFKSLDCVNPVNTPAGAERFCPGGGVHGRHRLAARRQRLGDAPEPVRGYDVHPLEGRRNAPSHPSPMRRPSTPFR